MFRKIYEELVLIRKELQAIRSSLELRNINNLRSERKTKVIKEDGVVKRVLL